MKRSASTSPIPDSSSGNQWNSRTEMLASAMMLVSISEEQPLNIHHNPRNLSSSKINGSGGSLSGWGSTESRKSYKVDLNLISDSKAQQEFKIVDDSSSMRIEQQPVDEWGFFFDS